MTQHTYSCGHVGSYELNRAVSGLPCPNCRPDLNTPLPATQQTKLIGQNRPMLEPEPKPEDPYRKWLKVKRGRPLNQIPYSDAGDEEYLMAVKMKTRIRSEEKKLIEEAARERPRIYEELMHWLFVMNQNA